MVVGTVKLLMKLFVLNSGISDGASSGAFAVLSMGFESDGGDHAALCNAPHAASDNATSATRACFNIVFPLFVLTAPPPQSARSVWVLPATDPFPQHEALS